MTAFEIAVAAGNDILGMSDLLFPCLLRTTQRNMEEDALEK